MLVWRWNWFTNPLTRVVQVAPLAALSMWRQTQSWCAPERQQNSHRCRPVGLLEMMALADPADALKPAAQIQWFSLAVPTCPGWK
jgi:hypothetical protein